MEEFMVRDQRFVFTAVLFVLVLLILVNQIFFCSVFLGSAASVMFLFINVVYLGHAFFRQENTFVRFVLGGLILLTVIGLVGWIALIAYNLDAFRLGVALGILAGFSSLSNRLKQRLEGGAR